MTKQMTAEEVHPNLLLGTRPYSHFNGTLCN